MSDPAISVEVIKEKLRREVAFLRWLDEQPYCKESPVGEELRRTATHHRIALRNTLAELEPELVNHE